jgi:hypothetical protein
MNDYSALKRLAEAAKRDQHDYEALNDYGVAASPAAILALIAENEYARMRIKELDLLFGRYLLGMRASVIEWQHGKGADAAMQWIWNGLAGPGELPPENETQAQAYFDREIVAVEAGMEEVAVFFDLRRTAKQVTP